MKVQYKVPVEFVQRKTVSSDEEFGVLGYFGDILVALENKSGRSVRFGLALSENVQHDVFLQNNQRWDIDMLAVDFIRKRFMPYIRTNETIEIDVVWRFHGD